MSSYPTYTNGYAPGQYPAVVPNQFYAAPPPNTQLYNGYAAPYRPRYRRPSDPGPQLYGLKPAPRRGRSARQSEDDETPRISGPLKQRRPSLRPGITPDFLFITLSSHDTLKIANIKSSWLVEVLRETLLPYWPQRIPSVNDREESGEWQVKLGGEVWSAGGTHGIIARRFICRLFTILAEEGFGYLATVDNHVIKAPRLVFTSVPPEVQPRYFMIAFSLNHRTLTIIDAPEKLAILLGAALRATEPLARPNQAATTPRIRPSDTWIAPGVYEVVTGDSGMKRQDLATLMGDVLKLIVSHGWRFEASVPLGKVGLFGLRGRREMWMFRRDPAAHPQPKLRRETRRRL